MKPFFRPATLLALIVVAGCVNVAIDPNQLPTDMRLAKGVTLPVPAGLGIYLPNAAIERSEYFGGQMLQRGRFMRQGIDLAARHFYKTVVLRDAPTADPIQLMLDLDPKWTFTPGKVQLELAYKLYDAGAKLLKSGSRGDTIELANDAPNVTLTNVAVRATQKVMADLVNSGEGIPAAGSPTTTIAQFPIAPLINEDSPYLLSTGFLINQAGQVLTSLSGVDDCMRTEVAIGEARRPAQVVARSVLLNLAVVDTGAGAPDALSFATARPALGATTTSVSYVRAKAAGQPPTRGLAFGNVVSFDGVAGAVGVFQFATATKPTTFGSPIVGPDGKVVGAYIGNYPAETLQKAGTLPANTWEALNGDLVTRFLDRNKVAYSTADSADGRLPVDRATAATVYVSCYQ